MKRVPHARKVQQAIRGTGAAVKVALKGVNTAAAQAMEKGDYASAETLVAKAREIMAFEAEVDGLGDRWRNLHKTGRAHGAKNLRTPLWTYYQPILKALVTVGGEARRDELEPEVQQLMGSIFQPGDHDIMARGLLRWQREIRRARKQLVAEGWLEEGPGRVWRVTAAGRQAATKPIEAVKKRNA